ncbi:MAG: hypothetical protein ISN29_12455 [Gammaproteobacteria bacterium AqS3]|nr:hypothetical protein [Gammaproteobacteria bacterium AqS3]
MSWLDDLRNRKNKNAGTINVEIGDDAIIPVPLKYPIGKDKAEIIEAIASMEKEKDPGKIVMNMDSIDIMIVGKCIDDSSDTITEDEVIMLVRESGGRDGNLVRRCAQLFGLSGLLNIEKYKHEGNITSKGGGKRGR